MLRADTFLLDDGAYNNYGGGRVNRKSTVCTKTNERLLANVVVHFRYVGWKRAKLQVRITERRGCKEHGEPEDNQ